MSLNESPLEYPDTSMGAVNTITKGGHPPLSPKHGKVRIRFRKDGPLRFISHNDLLRCWDRLLRRTGLPIRFSEGFHPKPYLSSPLSLALGLIGLEEILDIELTEDLPVMLVRQRLEQASIAGLTVVGVTRVPVKARARVIAAEYLCPLPPGTPMPGLRARVDELLATDSVILERRLPGKPIRSFDLRPLIENLQLTNEEFRFWLRVSPQGTARPEEILRAVGLAELLDQGVVITRSRLRLDPLDDESACVPIH